MKTKKIVLLFVFFLACSWVTKAQITVDNPILCNGDATGQLTVAPGFGVGPYTYLWSTGAVTNTITNLSAGLYSVSVTDAMSISVVYSQNLPDPPPLTVSIVSTNVSCNGGNNGTAVASGVGGTGVLTYTWSNGSGTSNTINLTAGNYTVTVTDGNGCTATDNVTITEPPLPITVIASRTDVLCTGASTGAASVISFGGTGAHTYQWNTGATTSAITNVPAGNYQVTVTDANGCIQIQTIVIVEPAFAVSVSTVSTNVSCFGGNNGTITATGSGGVPSLNYLWAPTGEITPTISNLPAGTYTLTVTDANGCTTSTSVIITQPLLPLQVTITSTNINCFGFSDGTATANASGGSAPYSYAWSNGGVTATIINLPAGTYTVTVTDGNACTTTASVIITGPSTPIHVHTTVLNNVTCNGGNDGSVSATASGGVGNIYTYAWSNGSTLQTLTDLPMGVYTVTVTDLNGCTITASVAVSEPLAITMVPTITPSSCDGHNDGAISIVVGGGVFPYTFLWHEINFDSTYTTQNLVNVRGGTYALLITDANGCVYIDTLVIPNLVTIPFTATLVPYVCNGATGSVTVQATNAAPGVYFTYSWSSLYNTGSFTSNDSVFSATTSFIAGTYTITITDNATGCSAYYTFTINQSATPLVVNEVVTNNICYGDHNGSIAISASGGNPMPGYHITWTGPGGFTSTAFTITGLAVGDYTYTVSDDSVCSVTGTIRIEPLMPLQGYVISENVLCNATTTGHAEAFYSGGTGPLSYQWSNGATTPYMTGVGFGTYTLTVTDSVGCSITASATITQPPAITITLDSLNNIHCNGGNDGAIYITTGGGKGPLQYTWLHNGNVFAVTEDIINVPAGVYQITVMDSVGCFAQMSFTLTQPAPTIIKDSVNVIYCNNGSTGSWYITITGPNAPYTVIFSTGDTISTDTVPVPFISGLSAGNYSVTIISSTGCDTTFTLVLQQPLPITVGTVNIVPVICKGDNTGSIILDAVHGGTGPYTFLWNNGMTTSTITNIPAGMYNVTITDALGCIIYETYEVEEPYEWIKFFPTITSTSCQQSDDGQVVLHTEDIYWSPFINTFYLYDSLGVLVDSVSPGQAIGNLPSGFYVGILINQYGCSATDSLYVGKGPDDCILIPNLVTANGDGYNDVFAVQGGCEFQEFLVKIFTDWGEKVFESSDCNFTWNPLDNKAAANTVYYYYIRVAENGKEYIFKSSIDIKY